MKKVFKVIKDIFFKVFGKAWWFIVAAVVFFVIAVTPAFNQGLYVYTQGIRNETDDGFLKEFYLHDADNFSINSSGKAVDKEYEDIVERHNEEVVKIIKAAEAMWGK